MAAIRTQESGSGKPGFPLRLASKRGRPARPRSAARPAAGGAVVQLSALQRSAGNAAVATLVHGTAAPDRASAIAPFCLQRKGAKTAAVPAAKAPAKKRGMQPENVNNYGALVVGLEDQIEHWKKPVPINLAPFGTEHLLHRHGELLAQLHQALLLISKDPESSLALWQALSPRFNTEVGRAVKFGLQPEAITLTRDNLTYASEKLFYPAAYWAAKAVKKSEGHIEAPDMAVMAEKLKGAEQVAIDSKKLFEDATKMASGMVDAKLLQFDFGAVFDIVHMKGTIEEKLEAARKNGVATTAADLVSKVSGASAALMKQTSYVGQKYCSIMGKRLLAKGGEAAAKKAGELASLAKKFEGLGKAAEKVAKFAVVLAIINDYKNLVVALASGDYSAAIDAGVDLLTDAAPLAFGADLAGPLAVGIVVVKAQFEAIRLAAAFIRWCKDETVRQAALDFIEDCTKLAKGAAYDLVADAEILLDPTRASLHSIAARQIEAEGQRVAAGLRVLGSHVSATEKTTIGAYPDVKKSLGKDALSALDMPQDSALIATQQVGDVFKGANNMARYVKFAYTN